MAGQWWSYELLKNEWGARTTWMPRPCITSRRRLLRIKTVFDSTNYYIEN